VVDEVRAASAAPVPAFAAAPFLADLARLADVRALADRVRERVPRLDVLVNNAGVAFRDGARRLSADGFELTFAVNHLAHFLLAAELRPLLEGSAVAGAPARVAAVASELHARGRLALDDLQGERRYSGGAAYADSKLANVLFARALARRADPARLVAHALHPGVIKTKLLRDGFGSRGGASVERGAATSVHVALAADAARTTGGYWVDARPAEPRPPPTTTCSASGCGRRAPRWSRPGRRPPPARRPLPDRRRRATSSPARRSDAAASDTGASDTGASDGRGAVSAAAAGTRCGRRAAPPGGRSSRASRRRAGRAATSAPGTRPPRARRPAAW
jgi:NAD(P)-dependent dehydrogenase (short-subunit alcohol dehydrogenase family)